MLIEIINTADINLDDPELHPAIINVLCAYREGKHLVLSDAAFLQKITDHSALGNLTCNTARNLKSKIIEYNQLKSKLTYFCKVDLSSNSYEAEQENIKDNFFVVGYPYFNDSANIQITKLLCEDVNDAKLYDLISNYYRLSNGLSGVDVKFEIMNGGGANTKKNFELIKYNQKLCLCLLDSDKSHPKSSLGSTASKFTQKIDSAICKHYILEPHEVESLIPLDIIREGLADKTIKNDYVFAYEQTMAVTIYEPRAKLYFDHKNGLTINNAMYMDDKYNDEFWQDILKNSKNLKRKGCLKKMHCECTPPCIAIPGFGSGLLDSGTSIIKKMSHQKISQILPSLLLNEWVNIGLKLMSWGCTPKKITRTS